MSNCGACDLGLQHDHAYPYSPTTDLTIPSFERVSNFDFNDDEPLRVVSVVVADEDGWDW